MLENISAFLISEKILYKQPTYYKKGNAFEMFIYGADTIERFYEYIYKNSHVFLDRKNDKFVNYFENNKNVRKSKSGKQGVYFNKNINKWIATICINGKKKQLGAFVDKQQAIETRQNFEIIKNAD